MVKDDPSTKLSHRRSSGRIIGGFIRNCTGGGEVLWILTGKECN